MDPVVDYQVALRDLLMGPDTEYGYLPRSQGLAIPPVRVQDRERTQQHGTIPGPDLYANGEFQPSWEIVRDPGNEATLLALLDDLKAAWRRSDSIEVLKMRLGGQTRRLNGRPRGGVPDLSRIHFGTIEIDCRFVATDPLWYDDTESSLQLQVVDTTGGFSFPMGFPLGFGNGVSFAQVAHNAGNEPTLPEATIQGPTSMPFIERVSDGARLEWGGTLDVGQTLELNWRDKTVLLNGTASRYGLLQPTSRWFDLPPGDTEVRFGSADGQGVCDLRWRSAWS